MNAVTKVYFFDDDGEKFFGEGPARLLHAVEEKGSLRLAAISMDMAYTKALKLIRQTEKALGVPVMIRTTGGKGGGGSRLTAEGKRWLEKYEAYRDACIRANRDIYQKMFSQETCSKNTGCVIMASGLGTRFGGNKLLADFLGKPLIAWILDATDGLFEKRVVVTRHEAVKEICRERGIQAVLHDLPYRNDTIRLGLETVGDVNSCMFCPGDQPLLRRDTVAALLSHASGRPDAIWRTCCNNTPGSPVLFPRWAFPELRTLPEGKTGSWLIQKYQEKVQLMPVDNSCELMDADTPQALELLRQYASDL